MGALPGRALAGGFEIYEQSAAGTAMAGALSAKADDASAIFYNPAGIVARPGAGAMIGLSLAYVGNTATPTVGAGEMALPATSESTLSYIPHLYLASHIGDRWAVGLGVFAHFGADLEWPTSTAKPFPGRFAGTLLNIQSVYINPTVAYQPVPGFSIGVGVDIVRSTAELQQALSFGDLEGSAHLGGGAWGYGFNIGVLVNLVPRRFDVAFTYREAVSLTYDLDAHFDVPPELAGAVKDQHGNTSIQLPHSITFGLAGYPTRDLTITADLHATLWSSLRSLDVSFPSGMAGLSTPLNWNDTISVRVGGEYRLLKRRELALRIGVGYDFTPTPASTLSPLSVGTDRAIVSAGAEYTLTKGFGIGIAWIGGFGGDYKSTLPTFPATYTQSLQLVTLSLSYRFSANPGE